MRKSRVSAAPGRRRSTAELPKGIELLHPLALPGAEPEGCVILREVGGTDGVTLWQLFRATLRWSAREEGGASEDPAQMARIEAEMLQRDADDLGRACGLLAGSLPRPRSEREEEVARACLVISDWAWTRSHHETGIEFMRLAAYAWPRNARLAYLVASSFASCQRPREAELWFRRALRVSAWTDDWDGRVRTLIGYADLLERAFCSPASANRLRARAARMIRRKGLRGYESQTPSTVERSK